MSQRTLTRGKNGGGDEHQTRDTNPEVNVKRQKSNLPVNTGSTNIFYKTRLCLRFAEGKCPNGNKCTFAHGPEDLREPPPNWQELMKDNRSGDWNDDKKIIQRMRICRKFYNGEECPYGEKCTFLHEHPDKFKIPVASDSGTTRESSVIKFETVVDQGQSQSQTLEGQGSVKTNVWKTRICGKWETTGQCMFGDQCYFAHGHEELQTSGGRVEGNHVHPNASSLVAANTTEPPATSSASAAPAVPPRIGRGFLKLANKKLIGIYADWIDDDVDDLK